MAYQPEHQSRKRARDLLRKTGHHHGIMGGHMSPREDEKADKRIADEEVRKGIHQHEEAEHPIEREVESGQHDHDGGHGGNDDRPDQRAEPDSERKAKIPGHRPEYGAGPSTPGIWRRRHARVAVA